MEIKFSWLGMDLGTFLWVLALVIVAFVIMQITKGFLRMFILFWALLLICFSVYWGVKYNVVAAGQNIGPQTSRMLNGIGAFAAFREWFSAFWYDLKLWLGL